MLLKTGVDRGALLYVEGQNNVVTTDTVEVQQAYVPVGSKELQVSQSGSFRVGDRVLVVRPSTKEWIALSVVIFTEEESMRWVGNPVIPICCGTEP